MGWWYPMARPQKILGVVTEVWHVPEVTPVTGKIPNFKRRLKWSWWGITLISSYFNFWCLDRYQPSPTELLEISDFKGWLLSSMAAGRETCQPQCGHEESEQIHRWPGGRSQGFPKGFKGSHELSDRRLFGFFCWGVSTTTATPKVKWLGAELPIL